MMTWKWYWLTTFCGFALGVVLTMQHARDHMAEELRREQDKTLRCEGALEEARRAK